MAGGFGFVFSLLVGIISGAGLPLVLIRPLIFGCVFFILGGGAWILINNFVPELLFPAPGEEGSPEAAPSPGSRVDISLDDGLESALPEHYRNSGSGDEVGNIADLLNGKMSPENNTGMDQKGEDGYTKNSGAGFQTEASASNPGSPAASGEDGDDSLTVLPDLDSMAEAFIPSSAETAESPADLPLPVRSPSGNKPQGLQGDFNPKDLAAAIRTRINKE
jgi:hypothetical protein